LRSLDTAGKRLGMFAALLIVYLVAAKAGLLIAFVHGTVSPFWPATGLSIGALTILGPRWCPAIALGAFLVNYSIGDPVTVAAGIATGNSAEAILGAVVLRQLGITGEIAHVRDALILLGVALLVPTVAASVGVLSLSFAKLSDWGHYADVWLVWWVGDGMGSLFLTPLVLAWFGRPASPGRHARHIEAVILLVTVAAATTIPFVGETAWNWLGLTRMPVILFIFPPLVWAGLRLQPRWTTLALEVMLVLAVCYTAWGVGPFSHGSRIGNLIMLQMVMAVTGGVILILVGAITERDRHADRLMQALVQAVSGKDDADTANVAKTRLVAAVGHDLKQPLQAARLFLDVLRGRLPSVESNFTLVDRTTSCLEAMGAALDSLSDITAVQCHAVNPEVRSFPVEMVLAQLADECRLSCFQHGLEFRYVRSSLSVQTDAQLLARLLRNLLSNAVRYTVRGRVLFGCRRTTGGVRIEVWDTGPGIPPEDFETIFLAFHRGATAQQNSATGGGGGLGLGLATVKELATLLGLHVAVASRDGRGSMFSVFVPAPPTKTTPRLSL